MINDRTYLLKQNDELFNATLDEFSNNSYKNSSTNQIIKNSDYNKGSFYYRFKTKDDIYFALVDDLYSVQLSLYNSNNIRLKNINNIETLIKLIYRNTKDLYQYDKRYFKLLKNIYNEDKYLRNRIELTCIESLFDRVIKRVYDIYNFEDIDLLISTMLNLLFNNFNFTDTFNFESRLNRTIRYLIKDKQIISVEKESTLNLQSFKSKFNYIVSDKYSVNIDQVYRLSRQVSDKQAILIDIKNQLKIKQVTLTNVINVGIKKNLIDLSYLLSLEALEFSNTSYHKLSYIQKIILIMVYNTTIGREYQVLDNMLSNVSYYDLHLLFIQLLPKIAKISTIVIVDDFIYPNLVNDFRLYLNYNQGLKDIEPEKLYQKTSEIEVNYYEDDYLKTKDFKSYNRSLLEFIKNKKVSSVLNKSRLTFKDIIDYKE